jgi:hypothetical protein
MTQKMNTRLTAYKLADDLPDSRRIGKQHDLHDICRTYSRMSSFCNDSESFPAKWRLADHPPFSPNLAPNLLYSLNC